MVSRRAPAGALNSRVVAHLFRSSSPRPLDPVIDLVMACFSGQFARAILGWAQHLVIARIYGPPPTTGLDLCYVILDGSVQHSVSPTSGSSSPSVRALGGDLGHVVMHDRLGAAIGPLDDNAAPGVFGHSAGVRSVLLPVDASADFQISRLVAGHLNSPLNGLDRQEQTLKIELLTRHRPAGLIL